MLNWYQRFILIGWFEGVCSTFWILPWDITFPLNVASWKLLTLTISSPWCGTTSETTGPFWSEYETCCCPAVAWVYCCLFVSVFDICLEFVMVIYWFRWFTMLCMCVCVFFSDDHDSEFLPDLITVVTERLSTEFDLKQVLYVRCSPTKLQGGSWREWPWPWHSVNSLKVLKTWN